MKRLVIPALCVLALSACATPVSYGPAAPRGNGTGFTDQRIETDRYRVTFRGAGPSAQIQDYALLRAAEVTIESGFDWFEIVTRTEDANASSGSSVSLGTGASSYGRHSSVGVGVGLGTFDLSGGPTRTISMEIKLGHGPRPNGPRAYDARSVSQSVHARMGPPPPYPPPPPR